MPDNLTYKSRDDDWVLQRSLSGNQNALHVEHVHALVLSQNLVSLKTGGLVLVRGDFTGLGSGADADNWSMVVAVMVGRANASCRGQCTD